MQSNISLKVPCLLDPVVLRLASHIYAYIDRHYIVNVVASYEEGVWGGREGGVGMRE